MRYRNVSGHPDDDADGRLFESNDYLDFNEEQLANPLNQSRIKDGHWIEAPEEATGDPDSTVPPIGISHAELLARAKELNITGRTTMSYDELRQAVADAEQSQEGNG